MKIAVCPGSFDPVTNGHMDIIQRASELFDKVIVVVMSNVHKQPVFTKEERVDLLRRCTSHIPNVEVELFDGLLAEYIKEKQADAIVKGLRAMSDFEYEFQMALTNRKLCPSAETVFLTTKAEHMYLSSSLVRQVASFGGDITEFVPALILPDILKKIGKGE
jgi:pantetheine-phosphate adenylyltransferase